MNFDTNVNSFERGSRLVLSAALIGAVLAAPVSTPVALALIALYPAFTALMAWDPVYQLIPKSEPRATDAMTPVRVVAGSNTGRITRRM